MGPNPEEYGCTPEEFCENQSSTPKEFQIFLILPLKKSPEEFHKYIQTFFYLQSYTINSV